MHAEDIVEMAKDARRYRYLRAAAFDPGIEWASFSWGVTNDAEFDAQIDDAMKEQE